MSFSVYAVRLRGDMEPRYIGQTYKNPRDRLSGLRSDFAGRFRPANPFGEWLRVNVDLVEVITLATFETREEAKRAERDMIVMCVALGHRLFNADHVPRSAKIARAGIAA